MPEADQSEKSLPLKDNGIVRKPQSSSEGNTIRARLKWLPLFVLAFMLGGFVGLYFQPPGLQVLFRTLNLSPGGGTDTPIAVAIKMVEAMEDIAVVSEGDVVALGRVIPRGDVILVSTPFGSGDARISEIKVREGDQVAKGDLLAILDSLPQLMSAHETAKANVAVSEASLLQTQETVRASRLEAEASLARAKAGDLVAQQELQRKTQLMERGVTTRAALDDAIAKANEASRDVERAAATLSRFEAVVDGVQVDIALAQANLAAAKAQLGQAEKDVEKGYVRAPADGTILDIRGRVGERPGSDGLMDLGDTSHMVVEAEVYQTMIGRVSIGDPVTITADALGETLEGSVSAIGLAIGRQSITSDDPAANTDARVVDVIVSLDGTGSEVAKRFTNLQVVARIDAGRLAE